MTKRRGITAGITITDTRSAKPVCAHILAHMPEPSKWSTETKLMLWEGVVESVASELKELTLNEQAAKLDWEWTPDWE